MIKQSVVLVISMSQQGGAGKMLKYVANLLINNNYNVTFISLYKEKKPKDLNPSISYFSLDIAPHGVVCWRWKAIKRLRNIIKSVPHNIVCSFMADVSFLARIATIGIDLTYISAERNDPYTRPLVWKILTTITYWSSDRCVFQLDQAKLFFPKCIQNKSVVIPNPVTEFTEPFYGERKKTIVSAGRFVSEKRFENLIIAFSNIHSKISDYLLIIYGDGPLRSKYVQIAKELHVEKYVSFPGYIENLSEVIKEDGLFVLTSRSEGIPNVLIEALSTGIPTISTDCTPGGPYFLTDGGKNGVLVPVDDICLLEKAIIEVITNKSLSKTLSDRGPLIIQQLIPEKIDSMWLNFFK